jgi:glycosyltransferase involved in cell wall biosynthesis
MTASESIDVSVVIPCLNEAKTLGGCVDKALAAFRTAGIRGEVVVSDNGSTDGSIEIAKERGARVVHATAKGYGNALRKGIEEARSEFVVIGDADGTYDFGDVPRFVQKRREGYEIVMGNRFAGGIKPGAMRWTHQYFGNPVMTAILNVMFRTGIRDAHTGMRGFTKDVFRRMDLRTTGWEFASEFVIKATKLDARMTEIPVVLWPDLRGRPPHLRSIPGAWRNLRFMLLFAPNWLFLGPGIGLAAVGLALVLWLLPGERHVNGVSFDINTMFVGMVLTLLGVQTVSVGLFAKVFSYSARFDRQQRSLERWLKRVTLEQGLIIGAGLALVGLVGEVWAFRNWAAAGFGPWHIVRTMIFWSLWFFIGVQVIVSSFFLSMLGIGRATYIGDEESAS